MTPENSKTLVIGGGHPQLCLIEALIEEGQNVTVLDDREEAPAHGKAHKVVSINRYNVEEILKFSESMLPEYVSSGGSDKAVYIMALVAEKLGIPSYVSSSVAKLPMEKGSTRKILQANNLPIPKTYEGACPEDFQEINWEDIIFPVVIKPDEGIGQTGVNKANSKIEAFSSIQEAFEASQNGKVLLQEFIEGSEIGVNGIVINGNFKLLTTSYRNSSRERGGAFGVAMEKVYPATTDKNKLSKIQEIMNKACEVMEINNAPIYAQIIDNQERGPCIIEVMPRLGGGEDPRLVHAATGFNLSKATALLSMGKEIDMESLTDKDPQQSVVLRFLKISSGTIQSINGLLEAANLPGIEKVEFFFPEGYKVGELKTSRERAGYILASGNTPEEALKSAERAEKTIKIKTL